MRKKTLKVGTDRDSYSSGDFLDEKDIQTLEKVRDLIDVLKKKHGLNLKDIDSLLERELRFPDSILNEKLTVLEAVVKYLKENRELSLKDISDAIGRDQRNVWHIYNKARKKITEKFLAENVKFWIPISIFSGTKLSALECITAYLKDEFSLNYHEIAVLLKRDDRTIWTVYQRARKKNGK